MSNLTLDNQIQIKELFIGCKILNITLFGIYLPLLLLFFYKVRLNLELSAMCTISLYSFMILVRMLNWAFYDPAGDKNIEKHVILQLINLFPAKLIWFVLYYFTFEMKLISVMLKAHSPIDLRNNLAKWRKIQIIILISLIFLVLIVVSFNITLLIDDNWNINNWSSWALGLNISVRCAKFILDLTVYIIFIRTFSYFVTQKKTKLFNQGFHLSPRHHFFIIWIKFLSTLYLYRAFFNVILGNLIFSHLNQDQTFTYSYNFQRYLIFSLIDFSTTISILYLFYGLKLSTITLKPKEKISPK